MENILLEVEKEIEAGRREFPGNKNMLGALGEEFGELARALLEGDPAKRREEAIQVAAVAIRIAIEGDADYPETEK